MGIVVDRLEALERQQGRLFDMVSGVSDRIHTSVMGLQVCMKPFVLENL